MSQPGRYPLAEPSGAVETDRLTLQHRIWLLQHNGNIHATPLDYTQPQHVLDIGCGTGVWSLAFASEHPEATVLGVDISPPKLTPELQARTPKVDFVFADAEADWGFAAGRPQFSFIYGRMLANSIRKWDHLYKEAATHLRPGGWLQIDDVAHAVYCDDITVTARESPLMRWQKVIFEPASSSSGIDICGFYKHTGRMRQAGFRFHRAELVRWYLGGGRRPTDRENAIADIFLQNVTAFIPMVTETAIAQGSLQGIGPEEARALAEEAVRDITERGVERGYYFELGVFIAQKEF